MVQLEREDPKRATEAARQLYELCDVAHKRYAIMKTPYNENTFHPHAYFHVHAVHFLAIVSPWLPLENTTY